MMKSRFTMLFGTSALALIFFPIFTKGYDYRFVIQAFAPLVAAGALSSWGLLTTLRAMRARRRPASP